MASRADRLTLENALAERAAGYWLLAASVVVLLPHAVRLPLWLTATVAALFGWRYFILRRGWPSPARGLRIALTLLLAVMLFRQYGTLLGREAGSALLAALLALKLLELQRLRDYVIGVMLVYFLIFVGFLYAQDLWRMVYLLALFVLTTATLVRLSVPHAKARFALRLAGVLLLQALPLALAMHLLFPRIQGSLWGLPADARGGISGLSENMRPGSLRNLILNEDLAFRAYFDGPPPPPAQRYWRSMVMWSTDGMGWTRGNEPATRPDFEPQGPAVSYTLMLEPSDRRWLPALDLPAAAPAGTRVRSGFILEANQSLRDRRQIAMTSYTRYQTPALNNQERRAALQLPDGIGPRTAQLAQEWRRTLADDSAIVAAALRYFREQPFAYTLDPPLLGADPVEEFLFESRRGYCEHYSSAFTTLMRAAGVPARVVTGYQGGEDNPAGGYLIVVQSDAHAWAEVWLAPRGWTRVDPTAAIAPERIEYGAGGLRRLMARGALNSGLQGEALREALNLSWLEHLRAQARLSLDTVNSAWQRWVLDYGQDSQRALLARLGLGDLNPMRLIGLLALMVAIMMALYMLATRARPAADPVHRAYLDYCRRLARAGISRAPHETAADFAQRAARHLPQQTQELLEIAALYNALRYSAQPSVTPEEFIRRVRGLRTV